MMNSPITAQSSVATLVDLWLHQLRAEERLDRTTINEYERVLRKLVIPRLGSLSLHELTTDRVNGLLAELGGQSPNRQRKVKVVTGAMLEAAVANGALGLNPVRGSLSISRSSVAHYRGTRSGPGCGSGMAPKGALGAEVGWGHCRRDRGDARGRRSYR